MFWFVVFLVCCVLVCCVFGLLWFWFVVVLVCCVFGLLCLALFCFWLLSESDLSLDTVVRSIPSFNFRVRVRVRSSISGERKNFKFVLQEKIALNVFKNICFRYFKGARRVIHVT